MSYPAPKPCPRCGMDMSWIGGIVSRIAGYFVAECINRRCDFSGGVASTAEGSAVKWNERVDAFMGEKR